MRFWDGFRVAEFLIFAPCPDSLVLARRLMGVMVWSLLLELLGTQMAWVRFPIWDRWGELTRFLLASEMALASYANYLETLPITDKGGATIKDPSGDSKFQCSFDDFLMTLKDEEQIYKVILPSYVALLEEHARNLIEELIVKKGVPASTFNNTATPKGVTQPPDQIAESYILTTPVEVWGKIILKTGSRDWSDFDGGLLILVEAFVVRNLIAHGLNSFNDTAFNRLNNVSPPRVTTGQKVTLNKVIFQEYLATMRAFARCLAGAVERIPANVA